MVNINANVFKTLNGRFKIVEFVRNSSSAGHLLWIYRQLIGMSYITLARQVQIYRNISDPLGRLGSWLFWHIVLQLATYLKCTAIHLTAEKWRKEIYTWTYCQHHPLLLHSVELKFLCSALPITIFAFVIIICRPLWLTYLLPQVIDVLKYNGNISRMALYLYL